MKNKKLIAGILTCTMIGGSVASLPSFAEKSPEAIIASAIDQAANSNLAVAEELKEPRELSESEKRNENIECNLEDKETSPSAINSLTQTNSRILENLTQLKKTCQERLKGNISDSEKVALETKIKNINHNMRRARAGKEVSYTAFELPSILTNSTSKPLKEESSKSKWKKIAVGAGVIALMAGGGYAAYKFVPAVQEAIDSNVLPLAQRGLHKSVNYTSYALSTAKNFAGDLYSSISKSGKDVLSSAKDRFDAAEIYTSSALSTAKSQYSKLYGWFTKAFHSGSSGNKTNLNLLPKSTKTVQEAVNSNLA